MPKKLTAHEFLDRINGRNLTAIGDYVNSNTRVLFRCGIDGNEWMAYPNNIFHGHGCKICDNKKKRKKNIILADHGEWLEIDVSTKTHPNAIMKIGSIDYEAIRRKFKGRIHASHTPGECTIYASVAGIKKPERIHKLIITESKYVDHRDHDGLNNLRSNLRPCTQSENLRNVIVRSNNKSGVTGVYLNSERKKWIAKITIKRKIIYLGSFDEKDDAIKVRRDAEIKFYGGFSYDESVNKA